jgi:hypothetical protein
MHEESKKNQEPVLSTKLNITYNFKLKHNVIFFEKNNDVATKTKNFPFSIIFCFKLFLANSSFISIPT